MASPGTCIYVINLDRSKERYEALATRLQAVSLPIHRISAVDGRLIEPQEFSRLTSVSRFKHDLLPAEVGCYMSHVRTLETFCASDYQYAVVLEDDALPGETFEHIVQLAVADHAEQPLWDLLKLQGRRKNWTLLRALENSHSIGRYSPPASRTVAQLWTRAAAERFLSRFDGVRRPIDVDLLFLWEHKLKVASIRPEIVGFSGVASEIGERRSPGQPLRKLLYQADYLLHRTLWSLRCSIGNQ